jgi:hypothetical protein
MKNLKLMRVLMFVATCMVALAGGSARATALTQVIDVTGVPSYGYFGDARNTVLTLELAPLATVTSISWDFTIIAYPPSWLSEMQVYITSTAYNGLLFTPSDTLSAGTEHIIGSLVLADYGLEFGVGNDGLLLMEFAESLKDMPVGIIDGRWIAGTFTVGYSTVSAVPEASSYAMMLLGLCAAVSAEPSTARGSAWQRADSVLTAC